MPERYPAELAAAATEFWSLPSASSAAAEPVAEEIAPRGRKTPTVAWEPNSVPDGLSPLDDLGSAPTALYDASELSGSHERPALAPVPGSSRAIRAYVEDARRYLQDLAEIGEGLAPAERARLRTLVLGAEEKLAFVAALLAQVEPERHS